MRDIKDIRMLIYGYGNIGHHVAIEFNDVPHKYFYDIQAKDSEANLKLLYDIAFICVPTDNINEQCDTSIVEEAISRIKANMIIIKSTVPVGFCDRINQENIVFSPEYWGTTKHSSDTPNFTILGGNPECTYEVADFISQIKSGNHKFIFTNYKTAELAKYMENCFIALKVTFCNEFAAAAKQYGINYEDLRNCFIADERVSPSHTFVFKNQPYYDSHCLNKDIPAYITQCKQDNIQVPLMETVHKINLQKKLGE